MNTLSNNVLNIRNAIDDNNTNAQIIVKNNIDYQPLISVVIPVFNVADYLTECINSITQQSLREIEIICIDDGSTDDSLNILIDLAKQDNRITVIHQDNLHAGIARNVGINIARGKYIHFMDSDDIVYPDAYQKLYNLLQQLNWPNILHCKTSSFENDNPSTPINQPNIKLKPIINMYKNFYDFYNTNIINVMCWTKLFRLDFLIHNNLKFNNTFVCNDRYFWITSALCSGDIHCCDEYIVKHRINNSKSLIGRRAVHFQDMFASTDKILKYLKQKNCPSNIIKYITIYELLDIFYWGNKYMPLPKIGYKIYRKIYEYLHKIKLSDYMPNVQYTSFYNMLYDITTLPPKKRLFFRRYIKNCNKKQIQLRGIYTYKHMGGCKELTVFGIKIYKKQPKS